MRLVSIRAIRGLRVKLIGMVAEEIKKEGTVFTVPSLGTALSVRPTL
jgi:hypothetical protein